MIGKLIVGTVCQAAYTGLCGYSAVKVFKATCDDYNDDKIGELGVWQGSFLTGGLIGWTGINAMGVVMGILSIGKNLK